MLQDLYLQHHHDHQSGFINASSIIKPQQHPPLLTLPNTAVEVLAHRRGGLPASDQHLIESQYSELFPYLAYLWVEDVERYITLITLLRGDAVA